MKAGVLAKLKSEVREALRNSPNKALITIPSSLLKSLEVCLLELEIPGQPRTREQILEDWLTKASHRLSKKEFNLVAYLARHNEPVSGEVLCEALRLNTLRRLWILICRTREKLELAQLGTIQTVVGTGYYLTIAGLEREVRHYKDEWNNAHLAAGK